MRNLPIGFVECAQNQLETARPLAGRISELGAKTFIGTKVIHAVPMKRLDYLALRGWDLPSNENGADDGYLIQYADQDQSNVPGFTGYISWTPSAVFEAAYKAVEIINA